MKSDKTLSRRDIGDRLIYFREKILGLTQARFAEQLGLTIRNIQIYEQATSDVSGEFYNRAFRQFGLDPLWLMTGEGAMPTGKTGGPNRDLVRRSAAALEAYISDEGLKPTPDQRARLMQAVYDEQIKGNGVLEPKQVAWLVNLVLGI